MRIALVTAAGVDDIDHAPLVRACAASRVDAELTVWNDPEVDWGAYEMVVVRSAWDYAQRRDEFLAWANRVASVTVIENPPEVLAWNTDKRYLAQASDAGLPVVPTVFVEPESTWAAPSGEFVVKPAVSAGSRDTIRYQPHETERAGDHVRALAAAGRTAMVQPYQAKIDETGERALVFIDGAYSHALTKGPLLQPGAPALSDDLLFAVEDMSPAEPSDAELCVARRVMHWLDDQFGTLLYARVDLVDDEAGSPRVLEIELAEPSLFHAYAPGSAERLVAALKGRAGRGR
jgi:O-ureido-D-serine cyclo-ligase